MRASDAKSTIKTNETISFQGLAVSIPYPTISSSYSKFGTRSICVHTNADNIQRVGDSSGAYASESAGNKILAHCVLCCVANEPGLEEIFEREMERSNRGTTNQVGDVSTPQ